MSITLQNLESALAGESMAYTKYMYFARIARDEGFEDIAQHFEHTADQEIKHAWGHLDLLVGTPTTKECLQLAIMGETYEFTKMYPTFKAQAEQEGNAFAAKEIDHQISESQEHAAQFMEIMQKAEKRFTALAKVEERHAKAYEDLLNSLEFKQALLGGK
jgi:rubrerythrin